jgi:hypothetical protein
MPQRAGLGIVEQSRRARGQRRLGTAMGERHGGGAAVDDQAEIVARRLGDLAACPADVIDAALELAEPHAAKMHERELRRERPFVGAPDIEQAVARPVQVAPQREARAVVKMRRKLGRRENGLPHPWLTWFRDPAATGGAEAEDTAKETMCGRKV